MGAMCNLAKDVAIFSWQAKSIAPSEVRSPARNERGAAPNEASVAPNEPVPRRQTN
jgi:hypothetical protein